MMVVIAKPMMTIIVKGAALAEGVKRRMIEQAALSLASKGLQRTSFAEVLEAARGLAMLVGCARVVRRE